MLYTQLLNQNWREDTRSESAAEDGRKFGIEATNAHVLELEVRLDDRIGGWPPAGGFKVDASFTVFEEGNNGMASKDTPRSRACFNVRGRSWLLG